MIVEDIEEPVEQMCEDIELNGSLDLAHFRANYLSSPDPLLARQLESRGMCSLAVRRLGLK